MDFLTRKPGIQTNPARARKACGAVTKNGSNYLLNGRSFLPLRSPLVTASRTHRRSQREYWRFIHDAVQSAEAQLFDGNSVVPPSQIWQEDLGRLRGRQVPAPDLKRIAAARGTSQTRVAPSACLFERSWRGNRRSSKSRTWGAVNFSHRFPVPSNRLRNWTLSRTWLSVASCAWPSSLYVPFDVGAERSGFIIKGSDGTRAGTARRPSEAMALDR